jgi:hypothetical protein
MDQEVLVAVGPSYRKAGWAAIASGVIGIVSFGLLMTAVTTRANWIPSNRVLMLFNSHDFGVALQFLLLIFAIFGLRTLADQTPPGLGKAAFATGVWAVMFVVLLVLLGVRWEDCVKRLLHFSTRDIWSMAHRCELAVIWGPSSLAEMVRNDSWIRSCAYRGLLRWNNLCLLSGLARYTPGGPREFEGSDFPCQYFFSSASPHLFLHGCCHTTTLDDTDRLPAAQEKAACLRIKRFRFDIRPETLRSIISFRRSISGSLERCCSNSLSD